MRKPSELKIYVDNKIKDLSKEYIELTEDNTKNDEIKLIKCQLDILYKVQEICENRKKY